MGGGRARASEGSESEHQMGRAILLCELFKGRCLAISRSRDSIKVGDNSEELHPFKFGVRYPH